MNLQNPSLEILKENATDDSESLEKISFFQEAPISPFPMRNKIKSLAFPIHLNLDTFSTPSKKTEKTNYMIKDSLTYPEKKKAFKSQNLTIPSPLLLEKTNEAPKRHPKNHNFSYFIESDKIKSQNSSLNFFRKSYSQEDKLVKSSIFQRKNTKALSQIYESPDIKEFYKDIIFPENNITEKNPLNEFKSYKVNMVYHLQGKINKHLKTSLDRKFTSKTVDKIEENFESDELSEGRSEDFMHIQYGFFVILM